MRIISLVICAIAVLAAVAVLPVSAQVSKYESGGRRDPMVPLVGIDKPVNAGLENITSADDVKLEGIAISPKGKSRAILNGEMVKEGDVFGQLEIKKISKKEVIIIFTGTERTLTLSEEGGIAGGK